MQANFRILFNAALLAVIATTIGCRALTPCSESNYPRLEFSEGGGFTGALSIYRLYPDGALYFRDMSDTAFRTMQPLGRKKTRQIFGDYLRLESQYGQVHEPDNIYRSVDFITADSVHSLLWYRDRPALDSFYNTVLRTIHEKNTPRK